MCGIFFSLSTANSIHPTQETCSLLQKRGPDSVQTHTVQRDIKAVSCYLTFISTVLSLRGDHVYPQPLVDSATQSVLCWNGEAWKIGEQRVQGNDTKRVFALFLQAVALAMDCDRKHAVYRLADAVASISGPFSFVFYDAVNSNLFFSRDCLGRRSLLQGFDDDGNLKICSLCDSSASMCFDEVGTDGVYTIDLLSPGSASRAPREIFKIETLPWNPDPSPPQGHLVCTCVESLEHNVTDRYRVPQFPR